VREDTTRKDESPEIANISLCPTVNEQGFRTEQLSTQFLFIEYTNPALRRKNEPRQQDFFRDPFVSPRRNPRDLTANRDSDRKIPNEAVHRTPTRVTPPAWARSSPGRSRATARRRCPWTFDQKQNDTSR